MDNHCIGIYCIIIFAVLALSGYESEVAAQSTGDEPIIYLEWVDDPLRSMVVNWLVDDGSLARLEYRQRGSSGNWTMVVGNKNSLPHTSLERNSVHIMGLTPGSSYEFRLEGSSKVYYFRTAPASISEPMQFAIGGDIYREGGSQAEEDEMREMFRGIASEASERDSYFIVVGGDLSHAVTMPVWLDLMVLLLSDWQEHMVTSQGYLIPFVAVIGNNDVEGAYGGDADDVEEFHSLFSFPQGQWSDIRGYGVLDFSDYLSIVTLDSGHSTPIEGEQTDWLDDRLSERSGQMHTFPVYHVAGWPIFRSFRGTHEDPVRNYWHPVFEANNIHMVFEHHDHLYKRTHPIGFCDSPIDRQADCTLDDAGVTYLGGGTWASIAREMNTGFQPDGAWYHKAWSTHHNAVFVEISDRYRRAEAVNPDGEVFDTYEMAIQLDPPVVQKATEVQRNRFMANWEPAERATSYRMDVARDENFEDILPAYDNRNVGNSTSWPVHSVPEGEVYYVRLRASAAVTTSGNSEPIAVKTIPRPTMLPAEEISAGRFTARWRGVDEAESYKLDVALDENFTNFVDGFEAFELEGDTSYVVAGLKPDMTYYYQVRATVLQGETIPSSIAEVKTNTIDADESKIVESVSKALADNKQIVTITVTVVSEEGEPQGGVLVSLESDEQGQNENMTAVTDDHGVAEFEVSSVSTGAVTYTAQAGGIPITGSVTVEYIPSGEFVDLGHNYPNPFRDITTIPLIIPEQMQVRVDVSNSIGARVRTLVDGPLEAGYYELEFRSRDLASGVYIYRIMTDQGVQAEKMMLVR